MTMMAKMVRFALMVVLPASASASGGTDSGHEAVMSSAKTMQSDAGYAYRTSSAVRPIWMPESIKTDGQKTYFRFPSGVLKSLSPDLIVSLFRLEKPREWRYSIAGDWMTIEGVFEEGYNFPPEVASVKVAGNKTLIRFNRGFLDQYNSPSVIPISPGSTAWNSVIQGDLIVIDTVVEEAILIGPDGHEKVFIKHQHVTPDELLERAKGLSIKR